VTAPDPRLNEIHARLDAANSCKSDSCAFSECQTERDAKYLLAELRKAHEALERVEALAKYLDRLAPGDMHYARRIRAAVAAAKGDEA